MLLPNALSVTSAALLASRALSTKDAAVRTVTTTLYSEYTTTYAIEGQTEEVVVVGSPGVVEVGGITTTLEIPAVKTHTRVYGTTIDIEIEPQPLGRNFEFIGKYSGGYFTERAPFITTWIYPGTLLELSIPERQTTFIFTGAVSTKVTIPPERTYLTVDGGETVVDLPGLTTLIETSESTSVTLQLPATTTTLEIGAETFGFTVRPDTIYGYGNVRFCGTNYAHTLTSHWRAVLGGPCIVGTTFMVTLPSSAGDLYLYADGFTTAFTLPGITTTFVPEQTITIIRDGSAESSVIPAVVRSHVTTIEGSSATSGAVSSPVVSAPITNLTYCEGVRGPLTPEEEVQLKVLFSDRAGASAFADYVVSYASQLVAQIDSVANIAVGDNDYAFTTAFDSVDIPGILGLASAAPIYTCFLSSLWAQALSNPQQYAKRDIPTQDEKIKLIVLFEKRENSGMQFDYAELLVDDTNNLIAEVQNVSAAAANGDLVAYASLFANIDIPYFFFIATKAPIYTEGLSAAFFSALSSYSAVATGGKV